MVELAGVATDPAELIIDDAESRHSKPATPLHSPRQQMLSPLPLSNNLVLASNDVLSSQVDVECDRSPAGKSGVSHLLIYADHQRGYHNNMSCNLFRISLGNVLHSLPGSAGEFHESF